MCWGLVGLNGKAGQCTAGGELASCHTIGNGVTSHGDGLPAFCAPVTCHRLGQIELVKDKAKLCCLVLKLPYFISAK